LLIYGDNYCKPMVLAYVKAVRGNPLAQSSALESDLIQILVSLAKPLHLPVIEIRFDTTSILRSVALSQLPASLHMISLENLAGVFASFGLPIISGKVVKEINDASSSTYHDWQRLVLGNMITVSDLDLIRMRSGISAEIVELKRSYKAVETWEPYEDDYPNFRLIWKVSSSAGLPLTILYNQRRKNPFFDDISRVSVFSLNFGRTGVPWTKLGILGFEQFVRGEYLT